MSGGPSPFGFAPVGFNPADGTDAAMLALVRQHLAGMQGRADQDDAPAAVPPGFTGFDPRTPPTGAPTPVIDTSGAGAIGQRAADAGVGLADMGSRTADLFGRLRSGEIAPGAFAMAAGRQAAGHALDAAMVGPNLADDFLKGRVDTATNGVAGRGLEAAASVAGLSSVVPTPRGALRSFGGAAAHDDPIAALEAALAGIKAEAPPPGPRLVDPAASSWDLYHGSTAGPDFARFDPAKSNNPAERAVFLTPDPGTASGYAGDGLRSGAEAGSRVFRTTVDPGKTGVLDLAHLVETDPAFNARAREITVADGGAGYGQRYDDFMSGFSRNRAEHRDLAAQAEAMGYPPGRPDGVPFGYGHIGAAVERARDQGLDTAILRGLGEHGGDDQVIALTPGRVRSHYAPDELLYSGGPGGAGVGAASALAQPSPDPTSKGQPMSAGLDFGSPPSFGDLSPEMRRRLLEVLQQPGAGSPDMPDATVNPFQPQTPPTGPAGPVNLAGYGVPAGGPTQAPQISSPTPQQQAGPLLAGTLGLPSMSAGQIGAPDMPAPAPQMPGPQQDASPPAPAPGSIPSLVGMQPPAMPTGDSGLRPPGIAPTAKPATPGLTAPSGVDDDDDAPNVNIGIVSRPTPVPPMRPQEFGPSATSPAATGSLGGATTGPANAASLPSGPAPASPAPAADRGFDLGDTLRRVGNSGVGDQMIAMAGGLLSGKTFAEGLGAGFTNMSRASQVQAASQLAQQELLLKQNKALQEQRGLTANARLVQSKLAAQGQNISDDQALAYASNSAFMSDLLKGALPPTEQYTQYKDKDGNTFSLNTRNGQSSLLLKADEDKTQTPLVTPEARTAAGIPADDPRAAWRDPNGKVTFNAVEQTADIRNWQEAKRQGYKGTLTDYQNERAAAGRNQTTINMPPAELSRDKQIGDAVGKDISDYIGAGKAAREKMAALNILSDAWKAGGDKITTGPAAERVLGLKQFARGSLGLNIGDDIAPSELVSKIGTQLATADAKSLTSRPTQFDFATYLRNNPGLNLTPEGNAALIDIKRQQAQHEIDLAALARRKENWDSFDDVVAQYDRTHPIISPLTGKPLSAGEVNFPGAPGAGGGDRRQDVIGAAPSAAIQALQRDPSLAAQFEAKYGRGSSSRYLGGR